MNQHRNPVTNFVYCMRFAPTREIGRSCRCRHGEQRHRAQVHTNLTRPLNGKTWQVTLMGADSLFETPTRWKTCNRVSPFALASLSPCLPTEKIYKKTRTMIFSCYKLPGSVCLQRLYLIHRICTHGSTSHGPK